MALGQVGVSRRRHVLQQKETIGNDEIERESIATYILILILHSILLGYICIRKFAKYCCRVDCAILREVRYPLYDSGYCKAGASDVELSEKREVFRQLYR
jgi:hypothetical protein